LSSNACDQESENPVVGLRQRARREIQRLVCIAALLAAASPDVARAIDVTPPGSQGKDRIALDSTFDTGKGSTSIDFNATFALVGTVEQSGPRARLTVAGSRYNFLTDPELGTSDTGRAGEVAALIGYGVVLPRISVIGVVGASMVKGEDAGVTSEHHGAKAVFSFYATPTDQTMAYGQATYSTIGGAYQLQGKFGVKIPGNIYLGPEAKYSGRTGNSQTRFGIHLSGLQIGTVYVGLSGGQLKDQLLGPGQYVSVNFYTSF
jgi:hypothetical protein